MSEIRQICQYLAASDVYRWRDVIGKVLGSLLVEVHPEKINIRSLQEELTKRYAITAPKADISAALQLLVESGFATGTEAIGFKATGASLAEITSLKARSESLESRVKDEWLSSLPDLESNIDPELYWEALRDVLAVVLEAHSNDVLGLLGIRVRLSLSH